MSQIRLEYSEKQGFNFETPNRPNVNTNGFYCIWPLVHMDTAHKFADIVYSKYGRRTILINVLDEWGIFLNSLNTNK